MNIARPTARCIMIALSFGLMAGHARSAAARPWPDQIRSLQAPSETASDEAAACAGDAPRRASLRVDTSAVGEDSAIAKERLNMLLGALLREYEILPAKHAGDPELRVSLEHVDDDAFHYAYTITLAVGDERVPALRHSGECESCTEGEVVEQVRDAVDTVAVDICTHIRRALTEPDADGDADVGSDLSDEVPPVVGPVDAPQDVPTPVEEAHSPSARRYGKLGLASVIIGTAALGTGLGLVLRRPQPLVDDPLYVRNTRPPGVAVLASAGAALIVGVTLLAIERARSRKRSQRDAIASAEIRF